MVSRFGSGLSALALFVGFATAPYTHLHPSGHDIADDGHRSGTSLRHAHLVPHAASADHDHQQQAAAGAAGDPHQPTSDVIAADDFVFQTVGDACWATPAVLSVVVASADLTSVWLGIPLQGPPAHGPPPNAPSGSRAPPVLPPAAL